MRGRRLYWIALSTTASLLLLVLLLSTRDGPIAVGRNPRFELWPDSRYLYLALQYRSEGRVSYVPFALPIRFVLFGGPMLLVYLSIRPLVVRFVLPSLVRVPRPGICAACGYDLRATPQRCPECGREVPGRSAS